MAYNSTYGTNTNSSFSYIVYDYYDHWQNVGTPLSIVKEMYPGFLENFLELFDKLSDEEKEKAVNTKGYKTLLSYYLEHYSGKNYSSNNEIDVEVDIIKCDKKPIIYFEFNDNDSLHSIKLFINNKDLYYSKEMWSDYNDTKIFGCFPKSKISLDDQKKINKLFKKDKLNKLDYQYTYFYDFDNKQAINLPVYEYRKYKIAYMEKQNQNEDNMTLDNGSWWLVEDILWDVDHVHRSITTKEPIFMYKGNNISDEELKQFVNKYLKNQIFKYSHIKTGDIIYPENIDNTTTKSKVILLLDQIKSLVMNKSYENNINEEIQKIIDEYNNKLKQYESDSFISIETPQMVVKNTEYKLESILKNIKKYNTKGNAYYELLNYVNILENIENIEDIDIYDDFQNDIYKIMKISIPFLDEEKQNKYKKEIYKIIQEEQIKISNYIEKQVNLSINDDFDINLEYKSIDDFIIYLRNKFHPIFSLILKEVKTKDIETSINESITNIINSTYKTINTKMINLYLNQINETYTTINDYLNNNGYIDEEKQNKYEAIVIEIIQSEIDYTKNINEILNELRIKWLKLNKVLYEIEDYINEKKFIENNKIKF